MDAVVGVVAPGQSLWRMHAKEALKAYSLLQSHLAWQSEVHITGPTNNSEAHDLRHDEAQSLKVEFAGQAVVVVGMNFVEVVVVVVVVVDDDDVAVVVVVDDDDVVVVDDDVVLDVDVVVTVLMNVVAVVVVDSIGFAVDTGSQAFAAVIS